jgi:quercetin dioxygenase-like cupin family protein
MKIGRWLSVGAVACAAVAGFGAGAWATKGKQIVLTPPEGVKFTPLDPNDKEGKGAQTAVIFGDFKKKAPVGFLLKVPPGGRPGPHTHTSDDYGVVIKGVGHNFAPGDEGKGIASGGWWMQPGGMVHDNHCEEASECLFFVYMPHGFDFAPAKPAGEKKAEEGK